MDLNMVNSLNTANDNLNIANDNLNIANDSLNTANDNYNNKNYLESIKIYTRLIDSNPNDFRYYTNRSLAYFKLDNYDMCLKDCIKTIRLNPLYGKGWGRLAATLNKLYKYDESITAYKKAQELEPNDIYVNMIIHLQNKIKMNELKSDPKLLSDLFSITMNNLSTVNKLMDKDFQNKIFEDPNILMNDTDLVNLMNDINNKLNILETFKI
jgi:tetratricopeptide (TPR) repeat protein